MNFNEYQIEAEKTYKFKPEMFIIYPSLGLSGESGEVAEKIKKQLRDKNSDWSDPKFIDEVKKELGDVLWYVAILCKELGLTLDNIATSNILKLRDRQNRNKLHGEGDNR